MIKLNYNIVYENNHKRINLLSGEKKEQYEEIVKNIGKTNLSKLGKSNIIPQVGDVFALSCIKGEYYLGKVLESFEMWETNLQVIVIYSQVLKDLNVDFKKFDFKNILLTPEIVFDGYWKKGFFKNLINIPLTPDDKNLDYGFFRMHPLNEYGYFVDSKAKELDHIPQFYKIYGVSNIYAIYQSIQKEKLFREKE